GSGTAGGRRATRASHLRTRTQRSVEGLARVVNLDPEVPPFVALEQAAQLVPSELEVVDEQHRPALVVDRVDLPSERAGEQLEAAGAWISRHVAASDPGPDALAHLAPGRLAVLGGKDEAQPGPGAVATAPEAAVAVGRATHRRSAPETPRPRDQGRPAAAPRADLPRRGARRPR